MRIKTFLTVTMMAAFMYAGTDNVSAQSKKAVKEYEDQLAALLDSIAVLNTQMSNL